MDKGKAPQLDNADLALLLMEQDPAGLRLLLKTYGGKVRGALRRRYARVLSDEESDEVLSRALERVWRSANTYDEGKGTVEAWFLTIAINCARDVLRAKKRDRHVPLESEPSFSTYDPAERDFEVQPDEENVTDKFRSDLDEIIQSLPHNEKEIMLADLAASHHPDEPDDVANAARLAARLGSTKGSIYVSRHKARDKIRRELSKRGHFKESE